MSVPYRVLSSEKYAQVVADEGVPAHKSTPDGAGKCTTCGRGLRTVSGLRPGFDFSITCEPAVSP